MTQIAFISLMFTAFSSVAIANDLVGSWQLMGGEYVDSNNKVIHYKDKGLTGIKVLSSNTFSFITMSNGQFWAAGAGNYQTDGKNYTEQPEHTSFKMEGEGVYSFMYKVKDGIWTKSRYRGDKRVELEIWKKLD